MSKVLANFGGDYLFQKSINIVMNEGIALDKSIR
jgi:hypothetical protein